MALAGHAGKAFWFSKASGEFVTQQLLLRALPVMGRGAGTASGTPTSVAPDGVGALLEDPAAYRFADHDDRPYETDLAGFGRTFPHPYGDKNGKYYTTLLTISPAGDELTLEFAKAVIRERRPGPGRGPDYLAVSFSSTDYVGPHLRPIEPRERGQPAAARPGTRRAALASSTRTVGLDRP